MSEIQQRATSDIGGYLLTAYGGLIDGAPATLDAVNAVSALGALAGVFAQFQAREMLRTGALPNNDRALAEVTTADGGKYYFGDSINACLFEGSRERPAFWNIAAGAARDPAIGEQISIADIARHTASVLGTEKFGIPRMDPPYMPTQRPIDAARQHVPILSARFQEIGLPPEQLMLAFGAVGQGFAAFAAGETPDMKVPVPVPRAVQVRLMMESAIPMSKLDFAVIAKQA